MSRTITLPDAVVADLEERAKKKGLTLEAYFLRWQKRRAKREATRKAVEEIEAFQERMSAKYGVMSDSVPLIREDRER